MEIFEVVLDVLNEFITSKAFNKDIKLIKRLPYIFIYELVLLLLCVLASFLSFNFIVTNNIIGYILFIISLILVVLMILPFLQKKIKSQNKKMNQLYKSD